MSLEMRHCEIELCFIGTRLNLVPEKNLVV
jgi:hypothetical protein